MKEKFRIVNGKAVTLDSIPKVNEIFEEKNNIRRIRSGDKYNFIYRNNVIVGDIWFDSACDFNEGFTKVELDDGTYNFIDGKGELLFKNSFYNASGFVMDML